MRIVDCRGQFAKQVDVNFSANMIAASVLSDPKLCNVMRIYSINELIDMFTSFT
jgi:hypothetical protein